LHFTCVRREWKPSRGCKIALAAAADVLAGRYLPSGFGRALLALLTGENSRWRLAMSAFSFASICAFWNTI
jgi:hypothetical protein